MASLGDVSSSRSANFLCFRQAQQNNEEWNSICMFLSSWYYHWIYQFRWKKLFEGWLQSGVGVGMLKNANSVPDVPRILIIRLKRRYMCKCVLFLRLMFLLLSARFFCNLLAPFSFPFNFGTLFITLLCFRAETLFAGNGDPLKVENWGIIERLWLHEYQLWGRAGGTWLSLLLLCGKLEILREIALKLFSGHAREVDEKVLQTS